MNKPISIFSSLILCLLALFIWGCSETDVAPAADPSAFDAQALQQDASKADHKLPVTFYTVATGSEGTTYTGTVEIEGAINATGTYVMPTKTLGQALHCTLILTLPDGTITIRMNCNMVTSDGRWKVLDGSGAYEDLHGGGSLVMPDDVREILSGDLTWK